MKNKLLLFLCICLVGCANTKLDAIKGKGQTEILDTKGSPVTKIQENGREMWTYRNNDCKEMIFFDETGKVCDLHELGTCVPEE